MNNLELTRTHTLSALLEGFVQPDAEVDQENAADTCLVKYQYDEALSGYGQLDASDTRIATKIAFCEWRVGRYDDALNRLQALEDVLEADGIGLLCELIHFDTDYKRRNAAMNQIWPRLQAVISAQSVPLLAAIARSQTWWPSDPENREQRQQEIKRLLSLHPGSQTIRLAVIEGMQLARCSAAEQYSVLNEWRYSSPMPRYLWGAAPVAAGAGHYDEALDYLDQLEALERRSESPSHPLLWEIALARCDIAVRMNAPGAFSGFEHLLADTSLNPDDRLRATQAALTAACNAAPDRVPALADDFLKALESCEYTFAISPYVLCNEAYPVSGHNWDGFGDTWSCGDLTPYQDILINYSLNRAHLFFRAVFAVVPIDKEYVNDDSSPDLPTEFWDKTADILGEIVGHEDEFEGRLLSLHTAIRANRHRPNWSAIGQKWLTSELTVSKSLHSAHGWLALEAMGRNADSARIFASGVIKQLRDTSLAAPLGYDLVEELASKLLEYKLHREFYQLLKVVSIGDERPDVQFEYGLASQLMKHKSEASSAYMKVLAQQPQYSSAIYNALLLCTTAADSSFLVQIAPFVIEYPEEDTEKKKKLTDALIAAQQRCKDKENAEQRIIHEALAIYPKLIEHDIEPEAITLRAAVALLALFRCAHAQPDNVELPPFDGSDIPFSPATSCNRVLFDLLKTGLVTVHPSTRIDAFAIENNAVRGWRFGRIRWRTSLACESLVERLRTLNGNIPQSWHRDILPLALEIARGEMTEYLDLLAQERGWPEPGNTEEVSDLTRELANEMPVAQAFHLAYLGAMSASDYKQKYPVSRQQAADMMVKRTGQRLESVMNGRFPAKAYDRPWKLPRSAISFALWGTILGRGDDGFTQRISELTDSLSF